MSPEEKLLDKGTPDEVDRAKAASYGGVASAEENMFAQGAAESFALRKNKLSKKWYACLATEDDLAERYKEVSDNAPKGLKFKQQQDFRARWCKEKYLVEKLQSVQRACLSNFPKTHVVV